jgi:hypothetical protein
VKYTGADGKSSDWTAVEFLWIRWFGRDSSAPSGFKARQFHRVGFLDNSEPGAFGFIDPQVVIRAMHLIPAFAHGHTDNLLVGPSIVWQHNVEDDDAQDTDYTYYYVNM